MINYFEDDYEHFDSIKARNFLPSEQILNYQEPHGLGCSWPNCYA
jgi:hypothetical protein